MDFVFRYKTDALSPELNELGNLYEQRGIVIIYLDGIYRKDYQEAVRGAKEG